MYDYDTIVIGAGNGGLAASTLLAKQGQNVLLLERHNVPGGSATTFCRGRFEFEVSLHQLSGMGTVEKPGPLRSLLGSLDVLEDVEFVEMSDLFRAVIPGRLDVRLMADWESVILELTGKFPKEAEGIKKFFDLIYKYAIDLYMFFKNPSSAGKNVSLLHKYAFKTAREVLDEFFSDPLLKAALGAYWGFIGLTPDRLPFSYLAILFFSYIEFRPSHIKGGSQSLSNALFNRFIFFGGNAKFNCEVEKILIDKGKARGVRIAGGEEIYARSVLSNASKVSTYVELVGPGHIPEDAMKEMGRKTPSPSGFNVYMGLDCEPTEIGIDVSTTFILPDDDISDKHYQAMRKIGMENGLVAFSCYDVADPEFSPAGTCQVALVTLKHAEPWLQVPPTRYASEKYRCADDMIKQVEKLYPDIRSRIEEIEVASPLTFMRYLGSPRGAIYGFEQYMKDSLFFDDRGRTPIEGLYMAGGWVTDCGFEPTIKSGVSAARSILKQADK